MVSLCGHNVLYNFSGSTTRRPPLQETLPKRRRRQWAKIHLSLLSIHGITFTANECGLFNVVLSSSNAPVWVKLLHTVHTIMFDTLSHEQMVLVKKTGKKKVTMVEELKRVPRRPISTAECHRLDAALALLDDAISGGIVERLFQPTLVDELNAHYEPGRAPRSSTIMTVRPIPLRGPASLAHFCYQPMICRPTLKISSLRHIIRHLEALTMRCLQ